MAFRVLNALIGHGFIPRLIRPTVSRTMPTFVHRNVTSTANLACKSDLLRHQTSKISSASLADYKTYNSVHVRQHDRWYSQIFDNLVLQARDYEASTGGVGKYFGGREVSASEHLFWTYLLLVNNFAQKVDVRNLLLTAYAPEVKSCQGSSLWTKTTFADLPRGLPNKLGTYVLETSSGYLFTGGSYPVYPPIFLFSHHHGLRDLEYRFNVVASRGFKKLLHPDRKMDKHDQFNLWLIRECSRSTVSYQYRALGFLPESLVAEFSWSGSTTESPLLQLMETIDTIYNGSIMDLDFGKGGARRDSQRAFALDMRPTDMPKPYLRGANRTLAFFIDERGTDRTRSS